MVAVTLGILLEQIIVRLVQLVKPGHSAHKSMSGMRGVSPIIGCYFSMDSVNDSCYSDNTVAISKSLKTEEKEQ